MTTLNAPNLMMTFTTDGDGFRRSLSDGTNTKHFIYDHRTGVPGLDPLIMETDTTATTTTHYIHAHSLLATINHEPSPITHWYHFDALGTTRQLTDASATITDHYTFDA